MDGKSGKIEALQGLRAVAFLFIFLYHCGVLHLAVFGVSIFFVLSGFLMVYNNLNKNTSISCNTADSIGYAIKKIRKLYPLHIVTFIAWLLYISLFSRFSTNINEQIAQGVLNVSLLQSWVPASAYYYSFNGVTWYLSDLLFLYAAFPFFLCKIKQIKRISTAFMLLICIYMGQVGIGYGVQFVKIPNYTDNFVKWVTYICPAYRLGDFCIGGLAGFVFFHMQRSNVEKKRLSLIRASLFEIIAIIVATVAQLTYVNHWGYFGTKSFMYSTLFSPASVLLIICMQKGGIISKLLSTKPFQFIGNLSAYAFMIHQVVLYYLKGYFKKTYKITLSSGSKVILAFIITILLCLLFRYIENTVKLWKQKTKPVQEA